MRVGTFAAVSALISWLSHQRRRALREANEQREWFRVTLGSVGEGVIVTDPAGQVVFISPVAEALTGWETAAARGRSVTEVFRTISEDTRAPLENPAERVMESGVIAGCANQAVLAARDGSEHPIGASAAPIRGPRGALIGVVLVFRDVGEQRRRERQLERSESTQRFLANLSARLASTLDQQDILEEVARITVPDLADLCLIHLQDGRGEPHALAAAVHADPAKQALLHELHRRYPADPASSYGYPQVMRCGKPDLIEDIPAQLVDASARNAEHLELLRQLGLRSSICVPLSARGRVLGTITIATAESGRRYSSEDLALVEEVGRRVAIAMDNARLYSEVQEADRRKNEFLAMMAHELRNPLAVIRNAIHIARLRQDDPALVVRWRDTVEQQVEHMIRLVDDLLDVSRITRGKIELRREPVDLCKIAESAIESVQPIIQSRNQQLAISMPRQPVMIHADPTRMVQVLENLLNNATKYTEPGGRIWFDLDNRQNRAILRVRDDGAGIPPHMLSRIFDLFVQADDNHLDAQGGLGIGLTLVRQLVELHGGTVKAYSEGAGRGSEFEVLLPVLEREAHHPASPSRATQRSPRALRLLVVEDNRIAAMSLTELLQVWGHEVSVAHDGPAALEIARMLRPDVMLLDIGLPGMDGYEVARQLRSSEQLGRMTLVALTGYGQQNEHRSAGVFDHYLVKPIDPEMLRGLLEEIAVLRA